MLAAYKKHCQQHAPTVPRSQSEVANEREEFELRRKQIITQKKRVLSKGRAVLDRGSSAAELPVAPGCDDARARSRLVNETNAGVNANLDELEQEGKAIDLLLKQLQLEEARAAKAWAA